MRPVSSSPFWWALKGIFFYPMARWALSCLRGNSQQQNCCPELCSEGEPIPPVWVWVFWWMWCHHSARSAPPPRPPGKQNRGDETWMSNGKNKQIWFSLSSLPLSLWKELSSWLYTTGISFIEKKREWEKQLVLFSSYYQVLKNNFFLPCWRMWCIWCARCRYRGIL